MKRKISKLSLAELEKVMPVLDEREMNSMVGGIEYYDFTGNYLGKIGYSDTAHYISALDYSQLSASLSENDAARYGSTYSSLDSVTKADIIRNVGRNYSNLQNISIQVDSSSSRVMGVDQARYSDGSYSAAALVVSSKGDIRTFAELRSILTHENIHAGLHSASGSTGIINSNEDEAYSGQVSSPGFWRLSIDFRMQTARGWYNGGKSSFSKSSIAAACGVPEDFI